MSNTLADVLVKHFRWLLDQQREEQQEVLASESSEKEVAETVGKSGSFVGLSDEERSKTGSEEDQSDSVIGVTDEISRQSGKASIGSRSKRRRETKAASR